MILCIPFKLKNKVKFSLIEKFQVQTRKCSKKIKIQKTKIKHKKVLENKGKTVVKPVH